MMSHVWSDLKRLKWGDTPDDTPRRRSVWMGSSNTAEATPCRDLQGGRGGARSVTVAHDPSVPSERTTSPWLDQGGLRGAYPQRTSEVRAHQGGSCHGDSLTVISRLMDVRSISPLLSGLRWWAMTVRSTDPPHVGRPLLIPSRYGSRQIALGGHRSGLNGGEIRMRNLVSVCPVSRV